MTDVFSNDIPAAVDCDVLEAAKENIQPLASGRRVTALSSILATPHAQREPKLNATRNRLRINIELALSDEEDDSLEAYWSLVSWTLENYPQGQSAESGLMELLEEATRVLKDDRGGKWRKQSKYLKLWMLYASFVEKPAMIYRFLLANEIGTDDAILYEEYAAILERDGRRKEADQVYTLGIARKASPLERLKSKHTDFQKRMMRAAPTEVTSATATTSSRRAVLSTTSTTTPPPITSTAHSATSSSSNAPLRVFVDPTGEVAQAAQMETNTWPDIGTRKTRVKENVPEPKKIAGSTIRQAGKLKRLASTSGSKIIPYRDPSPDETISPGSACTLAKSHFVPFTDDGVTSKASPSVTPFRDECPSSSSVMKLKKTDAMVSASEAEALRKDPLKNYDVAVVGDAYEL